MSGVAGVLCIAFSCFLASAGGIGGGGVLVAVGLVVFGWGYDRSVVLALVAVFGNLLAQLALNYKKRHMTLRSRPLIYWDGVLLLCPAMLGGSSIGKLVAKILPDTVKKSFALVVLTAVTIKTFTKACLLYRAESKDSMTSWFAKDDNMQRLARSGNNCSNGDVNEERASISKMSFDGEGDVFIERQEVESSTEIQFPFNLIGVVLAVWLFYAVLFIIKAYATENCTDLYWVLVCIVFPPLILVTYWVSL